MIDNLDEERDVLLKHGKILGNGSFSIVASKLLKYDGEKDGKLVALKFCKDSYHQQQPS